jgi:stage III sporulation protein AH
MVIDLRRVGLVVLIIALVAVFASTGIKIIGMQSSLNREEQPVVQVSQPVVNSPVVPESTGTGDSYFTGYRMERERMRGKQVEMLRGILDQSSNDKEARQAASLRLVEISADMEREMKAENLIKAQGYEDCVIIIQPENTTVVIAVEHLQLDQEQELTSLVSKVTKSREDQIVIIARDAPKSQ